MAILTPSFILVLHVIECDSLKSATNPQMLTLLDLGDDLLVTVIPQFLRPRDTLRLSLTCKLAYARFWYPQSPIYKTLYNQLFTNNDNDHTTVDQGLTWEELFRLRTDPDQRLYTWGLGAHRRLGYDISQIPFRQRNGVGIPYARNVSETNGQIIVDIRATGYAFLILTILGHLYYTGWLFRQDVGHHTPSASNIDQWAPGNPNESQDISRGRLGTLWYRYDRPDDAFDRDPPSGRRRAPNTNLEGPPESRGVDLLLPLSGLGFEHILRPFQSRSDVTDASDNVFKAGQSPAHFASSAQSQIKESDSIKPLRLPYDAQLILILGGRQHVIALDDQNRVFQWDTTTKSSQGVELDFGTSAFINNIHAGWNLAAYYSVDEGIRVWYGRESVTPTLGPRVKAKLVIVPHTKGDIEDFAVLTDCVLFIRKLNGRLYQASCPASAWVESEEEPRVEELSLVEAYNEWLDDYNRSNGTDHKFTRINSTYRNFVLFTDGDQVLLGNLNNLDAVDLQQELQNRQIKLVVMGDYHYLALTGDGKCLAWGLELQNCGCLGLGFAEPLVTNHPQQVSRENGRALLVKAPLEVPPPDGLRAWVQLAASGWQSGGIVV